MLKFNISQAIAVRLEESIRDESTVGKLFKWLLAPCVADHYYFPLKVICGNPVVTFAVLLVVYVLFCCIFAPFWLASWAITSYGSWMLFFFGFQMFAVFIARSIAFPGCSSGTQKKICSETIKRLADYLEQTAVALNELSSSFLRIANGKDSMTGDTYTADQVWGAVEYFPQMLQYFTDAVEELKASKALSPNEEKVVEFLCDGMREVFSHFREMLQFLKRNLNREHAGFSNTLMTLSGRCLKASEKVRVHAHILKGDEQPSGDDNITELVNFLWSMSAGQAGFEKLSFPYLRAMLLKRYRVRQQTIIGPNGNTIDGVLFLASSDPRNPRGSVGGAPSTTLLFFCSPNAGFYECISQYNFDKSWFGWYLSLGWDVFVYNYRGYGRSQGVPTPHSLNADALSALNQLKHEFGYRRICVHGESIGGMIACRLAKSANVDALICDRTFSSLDAAAARLMGNWAGQSLRSLVLWNTDTVGDFVDAPCPKLILQDASDDIIVESSALRTGVANQIVFGHIGRFREKEWNKYLIARFSGDDVPQPNAIVQWMASPTVCSGVLAEGIVGHAYACCRTLLQRLVVQDAPLPDRSPSNILSSVEQIRKQGGHAEDHHTIEHRHECEDAESAMESGRSAGQDRSQRMPNPLSRRFIELARRNVIPFREEALRSDPLIRTWMSLCQISNGCGRFLGEAIAMGLDDFRCWVSVLIVWGRQPSAASSTGNAVQDLRRAIGDLSPLKEQFSTLSDHHFAAFMIQFVQWLLLMVENEDLAAAASVQWCPQVLQCIGASGQTPARVSNIGQQIPLCCGHNGWLEDIELSNFKQWLQDKKLLVFDE